MGNHLNIRKLVAEEFKKEFRKLNGRQPLDEAVLKLRKNFELNAIQSKINAWIDEKEGINEQQVLRKYHRNNLRYLTRYFSETLTNQLKSSKLTLTEGLKDQQLIQTTIKIFKQNPQCNVYH